MSSPLLAARRALKWSALSELASRAIAPLIFVALARFLMPEDFGVFAAATVVISFTQLIAEAGLGKALVHRQSDIQASATVALWMNLALGCVTALGLLIAADMLADFFRDDRIAPVIRVLSIQVLFAAASSVHAALLQKQLDFRTLFWIRFASTGLPAAASIPLALGGWGYWALVAGSVVGQIVQCACLWLWSPWRPSWSFDRSIGRELAAFGNWAMLSGLLGWFYAWMDALIIGRYLGSHEMGLYRTANTLVTLAFSLLFAPLLPVLYSLLSRSAGSVKEIGDALMLTASSIAVVALPVGACLAIVSETIETFVFGKEWEGVATIIALLAAAQGAAWIVGANGEAYRAAGKPRGEAWAMGWSVGAYLIGYLWSVQHGLLAFAITRCALTFVGLIVQIAVARWVLDLRPGRWMAAMLPPALIVAAALLVSSAAASEGAYATALRLAMFLLTYALLTILFSRRIVQTLWRFARAA